MFLKHTYRGPGDIDTVLQSSTVIFPGQPFDPLEIRQPEGFNGAMTTLAKPEQRFLEAAAAIIIPAYRDLDSSGRARFFKIIEAALADRPLAMRRQFKIFLRLLTWLPVVRFGRPFHRLQTPLQERFFRSMQEAPMTALRQGFWGLKTIVFMGYYCQQEVAKGIGYTPVFEGNRKLHA